jgi:hypothetical protein
MYDLGRGDGNKTITQALIPPPKKKIKKNNNIIRKIRLTLFQTLKYMNKEYVLLEFLPIGIFLIFMNVDVHTVLVSNLIKGVEN